VRAENRALKEQIEQMRLQQVRLSEDAAQARRLQALLAFKEQYIAKTVPAQVIGSSGSDLSRSIYIDKGSNDGVAQDMAVITAGGIVGKVLHAYPSTSQILMINDQSSGVGVLLGSGRLQGVLRGTPDGELIVERVMSDEQVAPGDAVLSSGGDQIFPKGLPVGVVSKASLGKELFLNIKVRSAADLGRLEEVLVVTEKQEHAPVAESGARLRAADILAQRLPSVPDKPAVPTAAVVAGSTANTTTQPAKGLVKPLAGTGNRSNEPIVAPNPAGSSANPGVVQSVNVAGHLENGEVLKKALQTQAGDAAGGGAGTSATKANKIALPAGLTSKSTSANPPVKTSPTAKPATTQPPPQPAPTEDNPH
jgi:rod shape-determining protein MreC